MLPFNRKPFVVRKKSILIAFAVVLLSVFAIGWWCIDRKIEIRDNKTIKATIVSKPEQQPWRGRSTTTSNNFNNQQQWFPSLEWIENCVVEETPKALEKGEFIRRRHLRNNKNKKQRRKEKRKQEKAADSRRRKNTKHPEVIGDCVKHCDHCGSSTNNSFTDMFRRVAGCGGAGNKDLTLRHELQLDDDVEFVWNTGNYEFVEAIHHLQGSSNPERFFAPPQSTLAIHLRLGDIIEKAPDIQNVTDLLMHGGQPGIRGGSHSTTYENGIKSVYEILGNVYESYNNNNATKAVHIRGGSHISFYYQKSRVYANCLHRAVKEGFRRITTTGAVDDDADNNHNSNNGDIKEEIVSMIIEGSPSEVDFYYLSHAKQLVVAPGAFSHLMGKLVERRGGTTIGRTFDGLTWKSPKPPP